MAGLAVVGYFLLFYFMDKTMMLGAYVQVGVLLLYFGFMYLAAKHYADLEFKKLLKIAFGVFVLTNLFYYAFDYYLFNIMDKSLADIQKDMMLDYYKTGAKSVEESAVMSENINKGDFHNASTLIFGYARGAIGGFGLSILVAYLVKER